MTRCIKILFTLLLVGLVVAAFVLTTFGWRHLDSGQVTKISVAAGILLFMYILMIFELLNRNLAALLSATLSITAHDLLIDKVTLEQIVQWQDLETLSLLLGMMIIVNLISETGLFDFLAVWCYNISAGNFWSLITLLTFITALLSAVLDNVSTMLFMAPTLIRLSELEQVDPRYLLMIMVIASNIGGCATPVGDPPNLIIIGNPQVSSLGVTFGQFTAICSPVAFICICTLLVYLKFVYKSRESFALKPKKLKQEDENTNSSTSTMKPPIDQLVEELELVGLFRNHLNKLLNKTSDKNLLDLASSLDQQTSRIELAISELTLVDGLGRFSNVSSKDGSDREVRRGAIKSKALLWQSLFVLALTVMLFFVQSMPGSGFTLGWASLLAALLLLVLSSCVKSLPSNDQKDSDEPKEDRVDVVLQRVEWTTLVFFFSLFITMEVMDKLGLIGLLGSLIKELLESLPAGQLRQVASLTLVLWVSGLASATIDNVPFTSMMVKVIGSMALQMDSTGEIRPLVYALAFGACLGGNGTLIGASANLVSAGISARYGYPISFGMFFKFAAPITVITLLVSNLYLALVFGVLWS